jgi:chromosome segregation ATPase
MKQFFINLGLVYLGGFSFYCAVVLWFNRPNLRRQLAVMTHRNDNNVSYSNVLNAQIRDLTDMNQRCYLDAVEQGNVISMYEQYDRDHRREVSDLNEQLVDYMNRDYSNKNALLTLESKYARLVDVNQKDFDTIADMRKRLADAHHETGKQRKQVEHHEITIKEYRKLLADTQVAVHDAQTEIRKAMEQIEFMKSELVMAERQLERLS